MFVSANMLSAAVAGIVIVVCFWFMRQVVFTVFYLLFAIYCLKSKSSRRGGS